MDSRCRLETFTLLVQFSHFNRVVVCLLALGHFREDGGDAGGVMGNDVRSTATETQPIPQQKENLRSRWTSNSLRRRKRKAVRRVGENDNERE